MKFDSTDPVEQFLIEVHGLRDRDGRLAAYRLGEDTEDEIRIARILVAKIAAMEREACAKVCEDQLAVYLKDGERWLKGKNGNPDVRLKELAPNLEEAWEAEQILKHGSVVEWITQAHHCAAAIRARGRA